MSIIDKIYTTGVIVVLGLVTFTVQNPVLAAGQLYLADQTKSTLVANDVKNNSTNQNYTADLTLTLNDNVGKPLVATGYLVELLTDNGSINPIDGSTLPVIKAQLLGTIGKDSTVTPQMKYSDVTCSNPIDLMNSKLNSDQLGYINEVGLDPVKSKLYFDSNAITGQDSVDFINREIDFLEGVPLDDKQEIAKNYIAVVDQIVCNKIEQVQKLSPITIKSPQIIPVSSSSSSVSSVVVSSSTSLNSISSVVVSSSSSSSSVSSSAASEQFISSSNSIITPFPSKTVRTGGDSINIVSSLTLFVAILFLVSVRFKRN